LAASQSCRAARWRRRRRRRRRRGAGSRPARRERSSGWEKAGAGGLAQGFALDSSPRLLLEHRLRNILIFQQSILKVMCSSECRRTCWSTMRSTLSGSPSASPLRALACRMKQRSVGRHVPVRRSGAALMVRGANLERGGCKGSEARHGCRARREENWCPQHRFTDLRAGGWWLGCTSSEDKVAATLKVELGGSRTSFSRLKRLSLLMSRPSRISILNNVPLLPNELKVDMLSVVVAENEIQHT
jgi:hypothetical protein